MMRNEILRALADPGEVADAELAPVAQGDSDGKTGGIGERPCAAGGHLGRGGQDATAAQRLSTREVEAEKLATVVAHAVILTGVDMWLGAGDAVTSQAAHGRAGLQGSRTRSTKRGRIRGSVVYPSDSARTQNGHITSDTRDASRRILESSFGSICRKNYVAGDHACTRVPPPNFHGKEGVDGSSPSEGFSFLPA